MSYSKITRRMTKYFTSNSLFFGGIDLDFCWSELLELAMFKCLSGCDDARGHHGFYALHEFYDSYKASTDLPFCEHQCSWNSLQLLLLLPWYQKVPASHFSQTQLHILLMRMKVLKQKQKELVWSFSNLLVFLVFRLTFSLFLSSLILNILFFRRFVK